MNESDIGREIEARCNKCKTDTIHIITAIENSRITRVMCQRCLSYHKFRSPDSNPELSPTKQSKTPKKRASTKSSASKAKSTKRKTPTLSWESLMDQKDESKAIDYLLSGSYEKGGLIRHKTFGVGIITSIPSENKIEVLFQNGLKTLVQNWQEN